jgi:hypothetical protein
LPVNTRTGSAAGMGCGQPPPIARVIFPVPPQFSQILPLTFPDPEHCGHTSSPVPGVPGAASSPGFVGPVPVSVMIHSLVPGGACLLRIPGIHRRHQRHDEQPPHGKLVAAAEGGNGRNTLRMAGASLNSVRRPFPALAAASDHKGGSGLLCHDRTGRSGQA